MGRMNDLDVVCQDLKDKAKVSVEAGERSEDISEAVFEEIFNWCGKDADLREWAMSTADMVLSEVFSEVDQDERIIKKRIDLVLEVLWHLEDTGQLDSMGMENRLLLLGRMRSISRNRGDAIEKIRDGIIPGDSDSTLSN